jgi:hypothetical protein
MSEPSSTATAREVLSVMLSKWVDAVRRIASAQSELRDIDRTIERARRIIERSKPITMEHHAS